MLLVQIIQLMLITADIYKSSHIYLVLLHRKLPERVINTLGSSLGRKC